MSLGQALQLLLEAELITLRAPLRNPNTSAPTYHPNERCAYHSDSPGHDTNNCWALKNKIQDMIDAGEIQFEVSETPNIITAPLPNHWRPLVYLNFELYFSLLIQTINVIANSFMLSMHRIRLFWSNIFVFTIHKLFSYFFWYQLSINNPKPLEGGWWRRYHNLQ